MRLTTCCFLVWGLCANGIASAETPAVPLFEPPPVVSVDAVPVSEPWTPPASADLSTPATGAAADSSASDAVAGESLPAPTATDDRAHSAGSDLLADGSVVADDPGWYQPSYWFGPSPWDTGIELGINGSAGTSESLSLQTGGYIKRESRFSRLDLDINYNRTTSGGAETQNNAQLDVRNDWLLDDKSPWTLFAAGNLFYDRFQAFDLQTNANSGVGYRFVREATVDIIGRCGAGASREIGGPDDRWVPEALFGFEYSQRISANQKFCAKLDYFPEWDQFGEYRLVADAGWEVELTQPENLSLKIAATDRYDSTPSGAEPHLVNYSVLLLLKL